MKESLLIYMLLALVICLNGCGKVSPQKIIDNMYSVSVDSVTIDMEFDLDVYGSVKGNDMSTEILADLTIKSKDIQSSMITGIEGDVTYDFLDGQLHDIMPVEAYVTNDSSQKIYFSLSEGQGFKYAEGINKCERISFGADSKGVIRQYWDKAQLSPVDKNVDGEKCYVFTYDFCGVEVVNIIDAITTAEEKKDKWDAIRKNLEEEYHVSLEQVFDEASISTKAYVSSETYYIKKFELVIEDVDLGEFSLNHLNIYMDMSDENNTDIDIPTDELKNSKYYKEKEKQTIGADGAYNEYTRRFYLCDGDENVEYTLALPVDCKMLTYSDEGSFFNIDAYHDGVYYRIEVSDFLCSDIWEYMHTGRNRYEEYREDVQCDYEIVDLNGIQVYKVFYSYVYIKDQAYYDQYVIFVPYKNQYGVMNHLEIEVNDYFIENWDTYSKYLLYTMLSVDEVDEEAKDPEMSDWLTYIRQLCTVGPYSEFSGVYHLCNNNGEDIFDFNIQSPYRVKDISTDTIAEIWYGNDSAKMIYVNSWQSTDATNELSVAFKGVNNDCNKEYECSQEAVGDYQIYFLHSCETDNQWSDMYYVVFQAEPNQVGSYYIQMSISPELGREWDNGFKEELYKMLGVK